jgi:hypothetical protein
MNHEELGLNHRVRYLTVPGLLAYSLVAALCIESPAILRAQSGPANVQIIVERVERVGSNQAHFWLKVVNGSSSPVFIEAHPFDTTILEDLWLQKWSPEKGWYTVAPCPDTAPAGVLELKPKDAIAQERVLTNPIEALCKERNIEIEGRFRFLVNYFLTEKRARTNERNYFSSGQPPPRTVVSEPFEIPPITE